MANHKEKKWQGVSLTKGHRITSLNHLSKETGLSVQSVRTSLNRLISTKEVTRESDSKYTLIKINNWSKYQVPNTVSNNQLTSIQQASNNKQEGKKGKNVRNGGYKSPTAAQAKRNMQRVRAAFQGKVPQK